MYKMVKKTFTSFLTGFIVVLPLLVLIIACWKLSIWFSDTEPFKMGINLPSGIIGSIVILSLTFVIGLFTKEFLFKRIIDLCDITIVKTPGLNKIFIGILQVMDILQKSQKQIFSEVVVVEYPKKDCYSIGFVTSRETDEISSAVGKSLVNVYIPSTPNLASGTIMYLPEADLIKVDLDTEIAMKAIISGGFVSSSKAGTENTCSQSPLSGVIQRWKNRKGSPKMFFDPRD